MQQHRLFQKIFKREENASDTKAFLKNITEQFPYFGAAHFYALKNTAPGSEEFNKSAAKTAVYFDNPFLLNELLREEDTIAVAVNNEQPETAKETIVQPEESREEVKSSPVTESEMLFEPLHATDYFASQGIKLSEVIAEDDKLGKQLKSFTAWLKTMKKVHPDKSAPADAIADTAVRNLAEKSNMEGDVVTEAMAEACIQQGKHEKAKDIYSKLSLLNPSKSAYFAAKIDTLK